MTRRNCQGITRRNSLQLGLSALLGTGLVDLLRMRSLAATSSASNARANTSCILVWLDGGPSHYETFDPKPDAPAEIRGEFQPISTNVPGIEFSEHLTQLAKITDQLAIVRSIQHNQGNHGAGNHYMMTGAPPRIPVGCGAFVSFHPSLGSFTAAERTAPHGLPGYFSIPSISRSGGPNFLGAKYAPFVIPDNPDSTGFRVRDIVLPEGLTDDRFLGRRDLRSMVDRMQRINEKAAADPVAGIDEHYRLGYQLVESAQAQAAFDIGRESDKVREQYGRNAFGQRCLLARRLVESGVPFITLNEGGWDHHTDIFNTFRKRMPDVDRSLAALVTDLAQRGLLERTLVVVLGEFGRTPKVNDKAGRDHWSSAMSVMFAGCGTPGGIVVGATDPRGYAACENVLSPENFASTIYRKLGIDPGKIYYTPQGRPSHIVTDPNPIKELMG